MVPDIELDNTNFFCDHSVLKDTEREDYFGGILCFEKNIFSFPIILSSFKSLDISLDNPKIYF